jgi:hypothetical protein
MRLPCTESGARLYAIAVGILDLAPFYKTNSGHRLIGPDLGVLGVGPARRQPCMAPAGLCSSLCPRYRQFATKSLIGTHSFTFPCFVRAPFRSFSVDLVLSFRFAVAGVVVVLRYCTLCEHPRSLPNQLTPVTLFPLGIVRRKYASVARRCSHSTIIGPVA